MAVQDERKGVAGEPATTNDILLFSVHIFMQCNRKKAPIPGKCALLFSASDSFCVDVCRRHRREMGFGGRQDIPAQQ